MEDLFSIISTYIPADFILIIAGLIVIGEMLKKFTILPNWWLTTVLPVLGAILTGIMYSTSAEIFEAAAFIKELCIGLVIGWAATGGYEWFKNTFLIKNNNVKKEINLVENTETNEEENAKG